MTLKNKLNNLISKYLKNSSDSVFSCLPREKRRCRFAALRRVSVAILRGFRPPATLSLALRTSVFVFSCFRVFSPRSGGRVFLYLNLFLLSILIRIAYAIFLEENPILKTPLWDAEYYLLWAQDLVAGKNPHLVFFTEPFYAYFLAFFLKFFAQGQLIVIILQVILGALLPIVIFKLTQTIFDNKNISLISALVSAIYGPFIFYEQFLLKTTFEIVSLSLFVYLFILYFHKTNKWVYFLGGIFLGLLVIIKGNNIIFFPVVLAYILLFANSDLTSYKNSWTLIKQSLRQIIKSPQRFFNQRKPEFILSAIFTAGFFLTLSPITAHNYFKGGDFVLTNYSAGANLYQGNFFTSDGALLAPPFVRPHPEFEETDFYRMAEAFAEKNLKPSKTSSLWTKKSMEEILEFPGSWLKLMGNKFLLILNRTELGDNYDYGIYTGFIPWLKYLPGYWLVSTLGFAGIILFIFSRDFRNTIKSLGDNYYINKNLNKQKKIKNKSLNKSKKNAEKIDSFFKFDSIQKFGITLTVIAVYSFTIFISHFNSRYRMPIVPFLIIISVFVVWYAFQKFKKDEWYNLSLVIFFSLIMLLVTSRHLGNYDSMTDATFYNNLGSRYNNEKKFTQAHEYYTKAIEINPKYAPAYSNLYKLYLRNGELDLARDNLHKKITLRMDDSSGYFQLDLLDELEGKSVPEINRRLNELKRQNKEEGEDKYDPYFFEGLRLLSKGYPEKAEPYLVKSIEKFDRVENTLLNLALIRKKQGKIAEAKKMLKEAIDKNDYFLPAKYNLANIYIQEKNSARAAELLKEIYDVIPEFGEVWYYLGTSYITLQRYDEAIPIVQGFIKRYSDDDDPNKRKQVEFLESLLVKKEE